MTLHLVDMAILGCMAVTTYFIIRLHNLFAVVMLGGLYSLLAATIFVVMDAVDVAFTEAAVGAGVSTVLALGALSLTKSEERIPGKRKLAPLALVVGAGALLIYGTLDLAPYGDPQAPANLHVAPRYLDEAQRATGAPNIVTAVLASYRGYDTLGETTVIFTAGIGVLLLLGVRRPRRSRKEHDE